MTATAPTADPDTTPSPPGPATVGLSRTADGREVPTARTRLAGRAPDDRLVGWLVTAGVTLLAGVLRFWNLGYPKQFLFDETYYAKDAFSLWKFGYARDWVDKVNDAIVDGRYNPSMQKDTPSMVVHPEVGKWLIGAGEKLLGFDSLGWRLASAVVGTLMVLVMVRLARRITRSNLLGGVAGLLLCFDGLQFVLSRLALLDIFVAFFLLSAVSCLVADRDWGRARMATLVEPGYAPGDGFGPVRGLRWRPWRLAAGVLFGLAIGSKWSALVPLAGLGLLVVVWDAGVRRSIGVRWAFVKAAVADGLLAFGYLVGVALVVYVATWTGWLLHAHTYEVHLSDNNYGPYWGSYTKVQAHGFVDGLVQGLRSLYHYHRDVWSFHSHGLDGVTHVYASNPGGWLILNRPVGVAADLGIKPGTQGCNAPADSTCLRQVLLLGTPALWWMGVPALLYSAYSWIARRDWRFGLVVVGVLTTWLPFLPYAGRPIFSFYAVVTLPFTVLALTLVVGRVLGSELASRRRRTVGAVLAGAIVVLVMANFAWFWPIYTDQLLTTPQWLDRIWFRRWI
ncbi:dolichyl-phosphate-mannose--protein mannosyltransferase [Nocardioides marmoribigeumensis]|uniref:Polyprenol-phosphate-mannose--protein mannosyltransferase n=1 Tax=Nocardioides marmoribigeumensis TaxID=433649 RepID=A0ABU2BZF2_9ACTN|nr:phospholipid carrier-dependent glycosyltransferase [Nocardioides marmoribigeumensis]MDR7363783.1 dolichyl-phosphate-mannose--protein O-mannosyl transferase [Nocardioides marmoribigeumensis]